MAPNLNDRHPSFVIIIKNFSSIWDCQVNWWLVDWCIELDMQMRWVKCLALKIDSFVHFCPTTNSIIENVKNELCWLNYGLQFNVLHFWIIEFIASDLMHLSWWTWVNCCILGVKKWRNFWKWKWLTDAGSNWRSTLLVTFGTAVARGARDPVLARTLAGRLVARPSRCSHRMTFTFCQWNSFIH